MKIRFKYIASTALPMWGFNLPKLETHVWKWHDIPPTAEDEVMEYLYDGRPIPSFDWIMEDPRINARSDYVTIERKPF